MHQTEPFAAGEEAEEPGPSVESDKKEERIIARRLRIAARKEAKTRYTFIFVSKFVISYALLR